MQIALKKKMFKNLSCQKCIDSSFLLCGLHHVMASSQQLLSQTRVNFAKPVLNLVIGKGIEKTKRINKHIKIRSEWGLID